MVVFPDVDDVLDNDRECRQRSESDAQVCHDGVGDNVGDQETACGATDADAEVAEGVVEVGVHGLAKVFNRNVAVICCSTINVYNLSSI